MDPLVLVVGDVMLDRYVHCNVTRVDQTSSAPVGRQLRVQDLPGGAGNVAVNLASLGCHTVLFSAVGPPHCDKSIAITRTLNHTNLQSALVHAASFTTTVKTRHVDQHSRTFSRIDEEGSGAVSVSRSVMSALRQSIGFLTQANVGVIVVSDYGKGVVSNELMAMLLALRSQWGARIIVDPVPQHFRWYQDADVVMPNAAEARQAVGDAADVSVARASELLLNRYHLRELAVTCGPEGIVRTWRHASGIGQERFAAARVRTAETTGAGDTAIAGLAAGFARGLDEADAYRLSVTASQLAVQRPGTSVVPKHEVFQAMCATPQDKVISADAATDLAKSVRDAGGRVAVTNGVFDLLHLGHHRLLDWAAEQSNFLLVLINSDASVRRLKGPGRPVMNQAIRAELLARNEHVDAVVIFEEDTPTEAISVIDPSILIKGPEYHDEEVPGASIVQERGGTVMFLPRESEVKLVRTSIIVDRIRNGEHEP